MAKSKRSKDWFKPKSYVHIDMPLDLSSRMAVKSIVTNKRLIARYAFKPLIHRCHKTPKYIKANGIPKRGIKRRHIFFACHLDSQIYSYYSSILQRKYENWLIANGLNNSIIAYRSIPIDGTIDKCKCHIHFAKEVFDKIAELGDNHAVGVIVADISGFFDNLDHKLLKKEWHDLLGLSSLPADHYNVFKAITNYSFIEEKKLFSHFKDRIISGNKDSYRKKSVARIKYLRDCRAIAYCQGCDIKEIRESGLISTVVRDDQTIKMTGKGIPQGLPISATLANIYMRGFDVRMEKAAKESGGIYRRYSDDIVMVTPLAYRRHCLNRMVAAISDVGLEIQKKKTSLYVFEKDASKGLKCFPDDENPDCSINYLGLNYDGMTIRLKSKSISRHYDRMRRKIKSQMSYALKSSAEPSERRIFENQFIYRFSKVGQRPFASFKWENHEGQKIRIPIKRKKYGNFLTYVGKVSKICKSDAITRQLSRNLNISRLLMANAKEYIQKKVYSHD